MDIKLTSRITREYLAAQTKQRLVTLAGAQEDCLLTAGGLWQISKSDLIDSLMHRVELLKAMEEQEAKLLEERRQEQLKKELAEGKVVSALSAIRKHVEDCSARAENHILSFQREVASNSTRIASLIEDNAEQVLRASEIVRHLYSLIQFINTELTEHTLTAKEIFERLVEAEDDFLRMVLDDSYRHDCTSVMVNINNVAKFSATQHVCKILTRLRKAWQKFIETGELDTRTF